MRSVGRIGGFRQPLGPGDPPPAAAGPARRRNRRGSCRTSGGRLQGCPAARPAAPLAARLSCSSSPPLAPWWWDSRPGAGLRRDGRARRRKCPAAEASGAPSDANNAAARGQPFSPCRGRSSSGRRRTARRLAETSARPPAGGPTPGAPPPGAGCAAERLEAAGAAASGSTATRVRPGSGGLPGFSPAYRWLDGGEEVAVALSGRGGCEQTGFTRRSAVGREQHAAGRGRRPRRGHEGVGRRREVHRPGPGNRRHRHFAVWGWTHNPDGLEAVVGAAGRAAWPTEVDELPDARDRRALRFGRTGHPVRERCHRCRGLDAAGCARGPRRAALAENGGAAVQRCRPRRRRRARGRPLSRVGPVEERELLRAMCPVVGRFRIVDCDATGAPATGSRPSSSLSMGSSAKWSASLPSRRPHAMPGLVSCRCGPRCRTTSAACRADRARSSP